MREKPPISDWKRIITALPAGQKSDPWISRVQYWMKNWCSALAYRTSYLYSSSGSPQSLLLTVSGMLQPCNCRSSSRKWWSPPHFHWRAWNACSTLCNADALSVTDAAQVVWFKVSLKQTNITGMILFCKNTRIVPVDSLSSRRLSRNGTQMKIPEMGEDINAVVIFTRADNQLSSFCATPALVQTSAVSISHQILIHWV